MIEEGMDPGRLFVALNSLDQAPIQSAREHWLAKPDELARFQREQRLEGGKVVLFVSRLAAANRTDLLIRAAADLTAKHPDLVVAIVGEGEQKADLQSLAAHLGIEAKVRFPGAIYGEESLAPWFLSASVFCYPSFMGLSVLHAFGYGLPVITSGDMERHGPEARAVADGENGLLVDLARSGSLAEAMDRALTDADLRARLSEGARRTALERYTLSNMVDGMESAIRFAHRRAGG